MRNATILICLTLACLAPSIACAQESPEVGVFAQLLELKPGATGGIGGRVSFSVLPHVQFELEAAKNFKSAAFDGQFRDPSGTILTQKVTTDGYELLAGPRFALPVRLPIFVSLRAGAMHFASHLRDIGPNLQPNDTPPGTPVGFDFKGTVAVAYPSLGFEIGSDTAGLRFDLGDEIVFRTGRRNNLKIEIGPVFRF